MARDSRNESRLRKLGWRVLVIWECETGDEAAVADRVRSYLNREAANASDLRD